MDETLYLFTRDFYLFPKLKSSLKRILGKGSSGPSAVTASLCRGLSGLKVAFKLNERPKVPVAYAAVLSGPDTLRWAILQKRKGLIKRLIAGPNIVITPGDYNGLILDPAIDSYVVPAQLSVDWWASLNPEFKAKLKIWPAGVEDCGENRNPSGSCLVYKKKAPAALYQSAIGMLQRQRIPYYVVEYGSYSHKKYLADFAKTKFAVFLSESESQGLALHEAWMANIPTLVWNRGYFEYRGKRWDYPLISAPYLTEACGLFFKGTEDFSAALNRMQENYNNFAPRSYSLANFTDAVSAGKFLQIIKNL